MTGLERPTLETWVGDANHKTILATTLWCYIRSKSLSNDYEKLIKIGITIPFDLRLEGVRRLRSCIVFEGTIKVCPAGTENRFLLRLDFR